VGNIVITFNGGHYMVIGSHETFCLCLYSVAFYLLTCHNHCFMSLICIGLITKMSAVL